jgi:nucleoside-diphosphate-sugar epimerase
MMILVTGSKGFIGQYLVQALKELGHAVTGFEGDITESASYKKFEAQHFDHCFHLAGKSFVPESWENPEKFILNNVNGTEKVLEFCRLKKISLTFISSYLYGIPQSLPISEKHPLQPNNPYALSKQLAENLCHFYSKYYHLKISVIRPFNVYGPKQDKRFLIPTLIDQFLNANEEIYIKDLSPKRDYIYISDLISALTATLNPREQFLVLNAGSGYSLSVADVITEIKKITGSTKKVISSDEVRINEIPDTIADITEIKRRLGWEPKVTFHKGLNEIIRFHES